MWMWMSTGSHLTCYGSFHPLPPQHDTETGRAPIVAPSMKGALKHPVMVHASGPV